MTVIEVFADTGCPFTHVGLRRFVARRHDAGRDDITLWVRAWPLEIVNGTPMDPHFIAEEVDDIRTQVAPDLFRGFTEAAFPATSIPAMALAAAAYDRSPTCGEQVSLELRDLIFERGIDVADPAVLERVAAAYDLDPASADPDRVVADHAEGVDRGVIGSPQFFTPAGGFFCPGLDVHRDDDGNLVVRPDAAAFDAFVLACLA